MTSLSDGTERDIAGHASQSHGLNSCVIKFGEWAGLKSIQHNNNDTYKSLSLKFMRIRANFRIGRRIYA